MEIFDVFSMNGIENNTASGEVFLENVILKVSQTHFSRISIPRGGRCPPLAQPRGGAYIFQGGQFPPLGGAVKYPAPDKVSHDKERYCDGIVNTTSSR